MLDLAAAAGADLAQTADITSDNLTAMGVPVKDAPHFMDVYAYALTNSNARLTDFGETMKYAAPVAKAFGSSLDETAAMVMMMANAGIKGSMAGTSLRMGLLRLAGPPKTATKEMEKLGLSLSDAQAGALEAQAVIEGLGIDLQGATSPAEKMTRVIMQLHEKTKNLSQDEKLAAFKGIFGVNAETGWLALFDQGPEVFLKYVEGLRNADGYSRQVAETMMNDTQGAITILESAMEGAYTAVGRALTPAIRGAAEAVAPLISAFTLWANKNPAIIQGVVGIIAVLSGLALAVAGVAVAFTAWGFITSQIAMFSAGIAAVRAGMLATEVASLGMAARVGAAYATMSASVTGAIATLRGITWGGLFAGLTAQIAAARVAVASFWASLSAGSIASAVSVALGRVATAIMGVTRAALAFIFSPIGVALTALALAAYVIYQNWDRLVPVFSSVGSAISSALSAAGAAVGNLVSSLGTVGEALMNAFKALDNAGGGDVIIRVFLGIVNVLAGVAVSIINIFAAVVNTVAHMFDGLGKAISAALEGEFSDAASHMKDTLSNIQNDWKNIHFSKLDFGYDIGANYQKSLQTYQNARVTQPVQATAEQPSVLSQVAQYVAQPVTPAESAPAQAPNLDTSSFQAQMQALGQSTEQPAQALQNFPQTLQPTQDALQNFPQALQPTQEALAQFPQTLQPTQEALANFPQSLQPAQEGLSAFGNAAMTAAPNVGQLGTASQTASDLVGQLGTASQTASDQVGQLGTAAGDASGNVGHLGTTAGNAAGSVGFLDSAARSVASALEGAASKISSINITVPTITVGGAAPAANYKGGIYDKGAFLTWFAEKSPEAAIPLDKSQRAINLWTQAGQMLGVLPNDSPINLPADKPQAGSTLREVTSIQREKIKQAQKVYETAVKQQSSTPKILTERERYGTAEKLERQLEKVTELQTRVQNLQGSQIVNSRSYQAIKNAQQNSTYTRSSILNAPAQYDLPTDRYQNLSIGGFNLRDIPFIGKIFDKANDSIRGIFGKQPVDVFSGIGRNVEYDIMHPTGTFPTLPSENKSQGSLPTDIFKNIGGIDLGNIPIIGGLIDKANGALRGIFGKNPVDVFSGIQQKVDYDIMHPTETFPNLSPMASTLPTLEPTNISPLEEVVPSASTSNYSAETFQPTFNITVNVTGGGENIDTQKIGEQIAFSARESFEKEYNNFMREKSRRGFA